MATLLAPQMMETQVPRRTSRSEAAAEVSTIDTSLEPNVSLATLPSTTTSGGDHSSTVVLPPTPRRRSRRPQEPSSRTAAVISEAQEENFQQKEQEPEVALPVTFAEATPVPADNPHQQRCDEHHRAETTPVPLMPPAIPSPAVTPQEEVSVQQDLPPLPQLPPFPLDHAKKTPPSRSNRRIMTALIALVLVLVAGGVMVLVFVVVLPRSDNNDPSTGEGLPKQCSYVINAEPSTCSSLVRATQVVCDCYNFCDGELVGCIRWGESQEMRASCSGTFVAGCEASSGSSSSGTMNPPSVPPEPPLPPSDPPLTQLPPTSESTTSESITTTSPSTDPTTTAPTNSIWPLAPELGDIGHLLPSSTREALDDPTTAQYAAYQWLVSHPNLPNMEPWKKVQVLALATLWYATQPWDFLAQDDWLSYSVDECDWITPNDFDDESADCDLGGEYQRLVLRDDNLKGTIGVPAEVGLLTKLTTLDLSSNSLGGSLQADLFLQLSKATSLSLLGLRGNNLSGSIPSTIGLLTQLTRLDVRNNALTGKVPLELENLSQLEGLWLSGNPSLVGTVPAGLCQLTTWTVGIWLDCENVQCPCEGLCDCAK